MPVTIRKPPAKDSSGKNKPTDNKSFDNKRTTLPVIWMANLKFLTNG